MRLALTIACTVVIASGNARAQEVAPELQYVPPGAFAVAHIRVADVLDDPSLRNSKALLLKRLPGPVLQFNAQFYPAPISYDRVTAFSTTELGLTAPARNPDPGADEIGAIIRCKTPFDPKLVAAGFGAGAKPAQLHGKAALVADGYALCVLDDCTFLVGHLAAVTKALAPPVPGARHELAEALAATAAGHAVTVGARAGPGRRAPQPNAFDPYYGARSVLGTYTLGAEPNFRLAVQFAEAGKASEALAAAAAQARTFRDGLKQPIESARQKLDGPAPNAKPPRDLREMSTALEGLATLALIDWLGSLADGPQFVQDGAALTLAQPLHPLAARLLGPTVVYAAFAAPSVALGAEPVTFPGLFPGARASATDNSLKQIGLALHNMESAYGVLPPSAGAPGGAKGKPAHSWRVLVLPYLEEDKLYRQFKLDEPWDSAHNLRVVADNPMPKVFELPGVTKPGDKLTHYQVFTGPGTLFDRAKKLRTIVSVSDGVSNTLFGAVAAKPVPWNQPADIPFDPRLDARALLLQLSPAGKPVAEKGTFRVLFADGSVCGLAGDIAPELLKAAITPDGGEVVDLAPAKK